MKQYQRTFVPCSHIRELMERKPNSKNFGCGYCKLMYEREGKVDELVRGKKDLAARLETPLADYAALLDLVEQYGMGGWCTEAKQLLHRLRPRGTKLTVAALVPRSDLVLTCTRKVDKHLPLADRRVCMPGGHVEPEDFELGGEPSVLSFEEALIKAALRETKEETGLTCVPCIPDALRFLNFDECGNLCAMIWLHADVKAATTPEAETDCIWMSPDELLRRAAFPQWYAAAKEAGAF